jgi:hypothetical protein
LSGGIALAGFGLSSATANAFNPQPEPPGKPSIGVNPGQQSDRSVIAVHPQQQSPGARVGFDPQPDPPGASINTVHP